MMNMRRNIPSALILLAPSLLLLAACGRAIADPASSELSQSVPLQPAEAYTDLTPAELNRLFEQQDPFFVNVHIPYEGEIPGTDAFVPYNEIEANRAKLPSDFAAPIVVYCRSGSMSTAAAERLTRMGYSQVYNLDGGFRAWAEAGNSFISP